MPLAALECSIARGTEILAAHCARGTQYSRWPSVCRTRRGEMANRSGATKGASEAQWTRSLASKRADAGIWACASQLVWPLYKGCCIRYKWTPQVRG